MRGHSRTGEGLHRFVDPEDGEVYLYTQYEPADARRVFANFEQPDLKAPFRFEVTAPEGWTVWSNGAEESRGGGVWRFAGTRPISTYITCVVAGPYHYVTDTYRRGDLEIPLGADVPQGPREALRRGRRLPGHQAGPGLLHDAFDYPYPFGKYDQAFVPEYNLGAMENPGLVTFREEYIYRGKVTRAAVRAAGQRGPARDGPHVVRRPRHHEVVGRPVAEESFADFMGTFSMVEATRFTNGWTTFANNRKAWAYRADQLPSTHPVTADIRDLEDAKLNFDGITYAKGASVLKQLVAYAGREAFLEGARRYSSGTRTATRRSTTCWPCWRRRPGGT